MIRKILRAWAGKPFSASPQPARSFCESLEPRLQMSTTINTATLWKSYTANKPAPAGTSPQAVLQVLDPVPVVGMAVDTRALNSTLGVGSPIDGYYWWNFGDSGGEYNVLAGFNATHIYTQPGNYTISLTVVNSQLQSSTVTAPITIYPDNRRAIYVDALNGNDSNNGSTPALAVKTAGKANSMITDNTEVFFDRGETFNLSAAFLLHHQNLLVGAYGTGSQPVINYTAPGVGTVIFSSNSTASIGVTVQDLTFTTLLGSNLFLPNPPMAIMAGGCDTSVLRCTFMDVEYAVNGSGAPTGLTVEDSTSPTTNQLQGYFVWNEGTDTCVIGNTVAGSVHEHVMRTSSATEILVAWNNFTNHDGKGCIEIHNGADAWIDSNITNGGELRVGPLGLWGESPSSATNTCVIQNNTVYNSDIAVYPGAHDIYIRNNTIHRDSSAMISVSGQDSDGRQSSDIRIVNNTGISNGTAGNFLQVENHVAGIILENNLLVQPNLIVGGYNGAPVYDLEGNLSSFTLINGNVWQQPKTFYAAARGGINLVGSGTGSVGYLTATAWNNQSAVGTDYFSSTLIDANGVPLAGSLATTIDSPVAGVIYGSYGVQRPTAGPWTAGAVEV